MLRFHLRGGSRCGLSVWFLALTIAGCGGGDSLNRGSVSGKVTLDGQPVETGSISFLPTDGTQGPMAAGQISKGQYSIAAKVGPVVGKYSVQIEAFRDTGKKNEGGSPISEPMIPPQYNSQTTLKVEIKKGANTHDFTLQSQQSPAPR